MSLPAAGGHEEGRRSTGSDESYFVPISCLIFMSFMVDALCSVAQDDAIGRSMLLQARLLLRVRNQDALAALCGHIHAQGILLK